MRPTRRFPLRAVIVGSAATLLLAVGAAWTVVQQHEDMVRLAETELQLRSLSGRIMLLDETLTMSARLAAVTHDLRWEARYIASEQSLDDAIKETIALAPEAFGKSAATETKTANVKLVAMEHASFELGRQGRFDEASALLFSGAYDEQKLIYARGMERSNAAIMRRADSLLARQGDHLATIGFVTLAILTILALAWWRIVALIRRHLVDVHQAEAALAEANQHLERRVAERTAELSTAKETIERQMFDMQRVELELRQAQKLEAVGRLAAGVAHEINTPVQFVSDAIQFAREATADLLGRIAAHEDVSADSDLQFYADELPVALDRAFDGLGRVAGIVRSMKQVAYPERREMTSIDLNNLLGSALTLGRSEYRYVADLDLQLGVLPEVVCHPGDISQAVLNLVINAAQAIGDVVRGTDRMGQIRVKSWAGGDEVFVAVTDDGSGIPEHVRERMFDPFYTTKKLGEGTGQGLAIARTVIVDAHLGSLTCDTKVGFGTTFTIRLPIRPGAMVPGVSLRWSRDRGPTEHYAAAALV